jgi:hypothetical protein
LTLLPSFRTATAIAGLPALRICIPEGIRLFSVHLPG